MKRSILTPCSLLLSAFLLAGLVGSSARAHEVENKEKTSNIHHLEWQTNFENAKDASNETGKGILLLFTGSDWCPPCKRLKNEFLSDREVIELIGSNFIPVMIDFPRTFELPEDLKAQNEKLKDEFEIRGYPTVLNCLDDSRPLGDLGFYNGNREESISNIRKMIETQTAYREYRLAKVNGEQVSPQFLDQLLSNLSEEILGKSWMEEVNQLVSSTQDDSELNLKWQKITSSIDQKKQASKLQREVFAYMGGRSSKDIVKYLESRLPEVESHPLQSRFLVPMYSAYLSHSGDYEKSLQVAIEMETAPWADESTKQLALDFQAKQYFRMNRIEEGKKVFHAYYQTLRESKTSENPKLDEQTMLAWEMMYGGCYEAAIQCAEEIKSQPGVPEKFWFRAAEAAILSYARLGTDLKHRAEWLGELAKRQSDKDARTKSQLTAAICYLADDDKPAAESILEQVETASFDSNGEVPFGQEAQSKARNSNADLKLLYSIAQGSQSEALRYLANQASEPGKTDLLKRAETAAP